MNKVIVLICAALCLGYVTSAASAEITGFDEYALASILIKFPESVGFVRITTGDSGCGRESSPMEAYDYKRTLLASVADRLFGGNTQENDNTSYYIDSATLCVAVSGIRYGYINPDSESNFGTSSDNLMHESLAASAPVPEPATMILVGLGLIGLSGLKKRKKK